MSNKILAVVKMSRSEEVIAKIEKVNVHDILKYEYPAMIGENSFSRKSNVSIIKI